MTAMTRSSKLIVVGGGGFEGDVSGGPNEIRPNGRGRDVFHFTFLFRYPSMSSSSLPLPLTLTSVCVLFTVYLTTMCVAYEQVQKLCYSGKECCENDHKGNIRLCICCSFVAAYFSNNMFTYGIWIHDRARTMIYRDSSPKCKLVGVECCFGVH